MRVLLYGSRGWIGGQIAALLRATGHTVVEGQARLGGAHPRQAASLEEEMDRVRPSHVVLAVGRTHGPGAATIDYVEDKLALNLRDNLEAPMQAARACAQRGVHMTYIGTGCIYEYDAYHPIGGAEFTEDDPPNFFGSAYSIAKGTTDGLLRDFDQNVLIVRIRMPVGNETHHRNFITKIAAYDRVVNIPNSVTVLPDLLPGLVTLMEDGVTGPLNFVNPGPVSHNEVLALYREIVDPAFTWQNFTVEEQATILKSGRSNCALDPSRLLHLGIPCKPALIAIRECMESIANAEEGGRRARGA